MMISTKRFAFASLLLASSLTLVQSQDCASSGERAKDCGARGGKLPWPCCEGLVCGAHEKCQDNGGGGGGNCPSSLFPMCVGWVRGKSGKLHVHIQVGGVDITDVEYMVNDANIVYETTVDGEYSTKVTTTTGDYMFKAYKEDFVTSCGNIIAGVTENENCFETAPPGSVCTVTVLSIELPGCPDASFVPTGILPADTCEYPGKTADSPCV
jgi:hypothetical protein